MRIHTYDMKDAHPEPFSAIADAILSSPAKAKADADGFGSPKLPRTPRTKDGEPLSAVAAALRESAERRPDDADEGAANAEDDAGSADEDAALFAHPANGFAPPRGGGGDDGAAPVCEGVGKVARASHLNMTTPEVLTRALDVPEAPADGPAAARRRRGP